MSKSNPSKPVFALKDLNLLAEREPQRMAQVDVTIGPVLVKNLVVWRTRNGHLRVFWPQFRYPGPDNYWGEVIEIDPDLRAEVEASIIAAYRDKRKAARAEGNGEA